MIRIKFLVFSLLFSLFSIGQAPASYTSIDTRMSEIPKHLTSSTSSIANYINSNFKTDDDKIRAIYYWTASNISYNVDNMYAVATTESIGNKIIKTLKSRTGTCGDYAAVFTDVANKVGVNTVIISGYTKQNGKVDALSHVWCASFIGNKWYLFDPTWASGYVDKGRFYKKMEDTYFKVSPSTMIATHMPFDNLWQFLNFPITNQEFYAGISQIDKSKKRFDFQAEIANYNQLAEVDQLLSATDRIEKNGVKNELIKKAIAYNRKKVDYLKESKSIADLNYIINLYQEGVTELNVFINYRNKQFKPLNSDAEIKKMIISPNNKLEYCQELLNNLERVGASNTSNINKIKKSLQETVRMARQHEAFIFNYLSKPIKARESLFYTSI